MSGRTRIKICGITDVDQALEIISLGVDALGFIFVKESPRSIEPEIVREIVRKMPPFVDAVGVFMNEDPDLVNDISQYCRLSLVQLHGLEHPDYCQTINLPLLKAFRVKSDVHSSLFEPYSDIAKGFLLDTFREGQAGGTGEAFDWKMVEGLTLPRPVILAGGLHPDNVGEAIRTVRPFAIDANSGVELEPGKKDMASVKRLIAAVRQTDQPDSGMA